MEMRLDQKAVIKRSQIKMISEQCVNIGGVVAGSFVFAYAINALYRPFGFLSTGFNGVSMMLNYAFSLSMPLMSFLLNIVFVVFGLKFVDKTFALRSVVGITSASIFLSLTEGMTLNFEDPLIAIVFGGLMLGTGSGIAMRFGGALGGMNILGKIMNKYFGISVGTFDIIFNLGIIIVAGAVFDIKMAMYTIMARFVATKAIDAFNEGFNKTKSLFIISSKSNLIADGLISQVGRGVTAIDSNGAYSGDKKEMLYCVVKLTQMGKVKALVRDIDPKAFMSVIDTKEVVGNGF